MAQKSDFVFHRGDPITYANPTWPQYQHDVLSSGRTDETNGPKSAGKDVLKNSRTQVLVDDNGATYQVETNRPWHLRKFIDGTEIWQYNSTNDNTITGAAIENGVIYFLDRQGNQYAINTVDGSEIWVNTPTEAIDVYSYPTVRDGILYWANDGGGVHAVYTDDGSALFQVLVSDTFHSTVSAWENTLVVCNESGDVYGVNAVTGSTKWTTGPIGMTTGITPAIMDGVAYLGTDDGAEDPANVAAIDVSDGTILWQTQTGGGNIRHGVVAHHNAIISADVNANVYAHDPSDGSLLWSNSYGFSNAPEHPIISKNTAYILFGPNILALNVGNGSKVFTGDSGRSATAPPTLHRSELIFPYSPAV